MLTHHLIPLSDREGWQNLLDRVPHGVTHTHEYNAALAHSHPEEVVLYGGVDKSQDFYTLCPLKLRPIASWVDVVTPYGLSGFTSNKLYANFHGLWQDFCKDQGWICGYILQHPLFSLPAPFTAQEGRSFLFLNLTSSLDRLFQNFSSSHRYEIRKSQPHLTMIINDSSQNQDVLEQAFLSLYPLTLKRVQATALYHFSPESLKAFFTSPYTLMVGAQVHGKIEAVSLFFLHGSTADYFLNASTQEGRIYAKNLIWKACQTLKERGIEHFNLGGGASEGDQLEMFKSRFGATPRQSQTYSLIFNDEIYQELCVAYPPTSSPYFPLYRSPKKFF